MAPRQLTLSRLPLPQRRTRIAQLHAVRKTITLLADVTPIHAAAERGRLTSLAAQGIYEMPRLEYARDGTSQKEELAKGLRELSDALREEDDELSERALELALEAELCARVGTDEFGALAAARYACPEEAKREAAELARTFAALAVEEVSDEAIDTCSSAPTSLLSRMVRAVRTHSPYHAVVVREDMAALAATGDEYVYIAHGRTTSPREAERVVVHEVLGHVVPRVRARASGDPMGELGTRGGEDTQEGYALLCEEREGFLGNIRKRELGLRHLAAEWMTSGAEFADVVRSLREGYNAPADMAVHLALRTFRGSSGRGPGLGRERVYLPYFCAVRAHLMRNPDDEGRLTTGQRALTK